MYLSTFVSESEHRIAIKLIVDFFVKIASYKVDNNCIKEFRAFQHKFNDTLEDTFE